MVHTSTTHRNNGAAGKLQYLVGCIHYLCFALRGEEVHEGGKANKITFFPPSGNCVGKPDSFKHGATPSPPRIHASIREQRLCNQINEHYNTPRMKVEAI